MGDDNYVNRLVDWIVNQSESDTAAKLIASDLEDLGRRLDAVVAAGSKGVHASVDRFDASRFLAGTYLLLGDILRLQRKQSPPEATGAVAAPSQPSVVVPDDAPGHTGP
jgi:hypothetical protein